MDNAPDKPQFNFQGVIDRVGRELQNAARTPFSEQAFEELKEQISIYAGELVQESVKAARRHRAENVSSADVQQASQYLVASTSHRIYRHAGTIGGLLFGTAFSSILSMITTRQYGLSGVVVTFVFTISGTFLMTVHMVKD